MPWVTIILPNATRHRQFTQGFLIQENFDIMIDPFGRLLILFCWGLMRFLFDRERDLIMTERALRVTDT